MAHRLRGTPRVERSLHAAGDFRAAERLSASRDLAGPEFPRNGAPAASRVYGRTRSHRRRRAEAPLDRPRRGAPPVRKTNSQRTEGDPAEVLGKSAAGPACSARTNADQRRLAAI